MPSQVFLHPFSIVQWSHGGVVGDGQVRSDAGVRNGSRTNGVPKIRHAVSTSYAVPAERLPRLSPVMAMVLPSARSQTRLAGHVLVRLHVSEKRRGVIQSCDVLSLEISLIPFAPVSMSSFITWRNGSQVAPVFLGLHRSIADKLLLRHLKAPMTMRTMRTRTTIGITMAAIAPPPPLLLPESELENSGGDGDAAASSPVPDADVSRALTPRSLDSVLFV